MSRPLSVQARRVFGRFRHVTPWRYAADLLRAARLRRHDPPKRAPVARPERLVVTLTTVPERADRIRPALRSLLDQTWPADRILLAWPPHSMRSLRPYPAAPDMPAGIELLACTDQGPATKLLPALLAEPDAVLVVADDDVIYPADYLETLLRAHRDDPRAALGYRGIRIDPRIDPRDYDHYFATGVAAPTPVDVLFGTWGYLVPPHALDSAIHDFTGWPPELRWLDDFWISGHLAKRGVRRRIVPGKGLPLETGAAAIGSLDRGPNRSDMPGRIATEAFSAWW